MLVRLDVNHIRMLRTCVIDTPEVGSSATPPEAVAVLNPIANDPLELQIFTLEAQHQKLRRDNKIAALLVGTGGLLGLLLFIFYGTSPLSRTGFLFVAIIGLGLALIVLFALPIQSSELQNKIDVLKARKRIEAQLSMGSGGRSDLDNPSYFDRLVAINIDNLAIYYSLVKNHTNKSFIVSISAGAIGFLLIGIGLILGFENVKAGAAELSYISAASGVITEFIAAVFFYLYNRTVRQMKEYHDSLLAVQNVLLAFKMLGDLKNEGDRVKIMTEMLGYLLRTQQSLSPPGAPKGSADASI